VDDWPGELAVDPAGNILVTGTHHNPDSGVGRWVVARLTPTGQLDPRFGAGGVVLEGTYFSRGQSLVVEDDGDAVVLGRIGTYNEIGLIRYASRPNFVQVRNVAPTVTAAAPAAVQWGQTVTLDITAADPGADAITRIEVSWGDRTIATLPGDATQATYSYPLLGTYSVAVTAVDEDGARGTQRQSLTVRVEGEPRAVGGAFLPGPRELQLDFNTRLRGLTNGDLRVTNLDTGESMPADTFTVYLDQRPEAKPGRYLWHARSPLPNGNYRATLPAGSVSVDNGGAPLAADAVFDFFVLAGDINRDRRVDGADFATLARNFGRRGTYEKGDLTGEGDVDGSDFAILAGNFGKSVPSAPAGVAAVASLAPAPQGAAPGGATTDVKPQPEPARRRRPSPQPKRRTSLRPIAGEVDRPMAAGRRRVSA
jgi:hypothetical protein